ncbi:SGNH/GDSL hydrolase family protein [Bacillus sp. V3B]|uniref:SGNH/GDSL hydrolase family protein n=1 Tax=Bacillus sp. V3B TaxID=2804915 RepID=UPI00210E9F1E|nr:SGNH/GDSL hydrolase family protein [Bacillus sp. V3B]MCQ6277460.1 SGNH/GDSL hydrolase family protein [Bacillus sp. V3B]
MKKIFIFLFLAILLLISCIGLYLIIKGENHSEKATSLTLKEPAPVTLTPQDLTIVAAGDSLTEGVGDTTQNGGYLPYLQILLEDQKDINQTTFYNFGVKGNRSDQLLKKVQTDEVKTAIRDADMVIVTIGGNDMMKVVRENIASLEKTDFDEQKKLFERNLNLTIDIIKQENETGHIVLVGLYNPFHKWFPEIKEMNEIVNEWNEASQAILSQYSNTYFVDIINVFENEEEELLYTDYFHPNNRGYELIAEEVFEELSEDAIDRLVEQKWIVQKQEEAD